MQTLVSRSKKIFSKMYPYVKTHKKTSIFLGIVFIGLLYFLFKGTADDEVRYITTTVEKGSIIGSVTASGQVSTTSTVELKPQATGVITTVTVRPGDFVKKGKLLFGLDPGNAAKSVRSAKTNLEIAKLDLEKLLQPPKSAEVLALESSNAAVEKSKKDAEQKIKDTYRNLLNSSLVLHPRNLSSTETPPTISGTYVKDQEVQILITTYPTGSGGYFSANSIPAGVVSESGTISTTTPQAIGDSGLYIKFPSSNSGISTTDWVIDLPNKTVSSYDGNNSIYQKALLDKETVFRDAEVTLAQNKEKMELLYKPDELEVKSKELTIRQRRDSLADALETLSDYYLYAPFDGTISTVLARIGDTSNGTLGTIITQQKIAEVSLNEVDVSKVSLGDRVTLTFDAVEDLTITGSVVQIDTVGTITQGVVNYVLKISFDTDDDRIKSGMSVAAAIITDSKQDILTVPVSSVKTANDGSSYVEVFETPLIENQKTTPSGTLSSTAPNKITVTTGISNDSDIEILSGVAEGTQIVLKTNTASSTKKTTTAPSILGGSNSRGSTTGAPRSFGR